MRPLILSCFPGIDLLGLAFQEVMPEACIVRGPDLVFGSLHDVRNFHPPAGVFGGVIGGPPCQAFSRLRFMVIQRYGVEKLAENLIPEFERVVFEAQPTWFLMENVPDAPEPIVEGYIVKALCLNNRWLGEVQNRKRRFCFGTRDGRSLLVDVALFEAQEREPAVCASGGNDRPVRIGGSGKVKKSIRDCGNDGLKTRAYLAKALQLQGLPADFLEDAPFTVAGKIKVVGNGVPLPLGRAIAKAVKKAMEG